VTSNDVVAYEKLSVKNMVKNHCLAKSISDASWRIFFDWLEYYGKVMGKIVIGVNPQYTSQECPNCKQIRLTAGECQTETNYQQLDN
jgi:putative transposase